MSQPTSLAEAFERLMRDEAPKLASLFNDDRPVRFAGSGGGQSIEGAGVLVCERVR